MEVETFSGVMIAAAFLIALTIGLALIHAANNQIRRIRKDALESEYRELQARIEREAAAHRSRSHLQRRWRMVTAKLIAMGD